MVRASRRSEKASGTPGSQSHSRPRDLPRSGFVLRRFPAIHGIRSNVGSCEGFRMPALCRGMPSGRDGAGVRKPSHIRTSLLPLRWVDFQVQHISRYTLLHHLLSKPLFGSFVFMPASSGQRSKSQRSFPGNPLRFAQTSRPSACQICLMIASARPLNGIDRF